MPSTKSFYSSKSESATGIRKKKTRTVFSRGQVSLLEAAFNAHRYLNSQQRTDLARTLSLTETQVKIWFQNRRNKWKRIIGTMDCNEPTDNQTNNNQKNNLSILPALPSLQHQNIEQYAVSNFPLAGVNGHYEQSSSINLNIAITNTTANTNIHASTSSASLAFVFHFDNFAINNRFTPAIGTITIFY
ncbi:unnamed protein product [Meloidogyne enterolobii]|uniref:Uncharacterized protein n=1 Tax=Meloidogyne enterolobii TaxID=390850 RepID=A0ACB0ZFX7_MELEN